MAFYRYTIRKKQVLKCSIGPNYDFWVLFFVCWGFFFLCFGFLVCFVLGGFLVEKYILCNLCMNSVWDIKFSKYCQVNKHMF